MNNRRVQQSVQEFLLSRLHIICRYISHILLIFCVYILVVAGGSVHAQTAMSAERVKSLFLLEFLDNITWKNESGIQYFSVVFLAKDQAIYNSFKAESATRKVRGKQIKIFLVDNVEEANFANLLYLNEQISKNPQQIIKSFQGKNTIVVTDNCLNFQETMINFVFIEQRSRIGFQVNRSLLSQNGFTHSNELVLIGGATPDILDVYRLSEDSLRAEKKKLEDLKQVVRQQRDTLESQKQKLQTQTKELEYQSMTLKDQNVEIFRQKMAIEQQMAVIESQDVRLAALDAEVIKKEQSIQRLEATSVEKSKEIAEQITTLNDQKQSIDDQNTFLKSFQTRVHSYDKLIKEKEEELGSQNDVISRQRIMLFSLGISAIVIILFALILLRNNRIIARINKALEAKNQQIEEQKGELEKQAQLLRDSNEELQSFSYSVSHDLRAPLRRIGDFSEALETDLASILDKSAKHYLERIRFNVEKMNNLIDDLLKLSRLSHHHFDIVSMNLVDIIAPIVQELRERHIGRVLNVKMPSSLLARADARLLSIAFENLLSNAVKFTGERAEAVIHIGVKAVGHDVVYFVKDNGAGFDMKEYKRLFGTFQRLHSEAKFPGNGIGLTIVKRIIQLHGGIIWAHGVKNEGATFYFTLTPLENKLLLEDTSFRFSAPKLLSVTIPNFCKNRYNWK